MIGVLKIANPAFTAVELAAQDAAADAIATVEPGLRVAVPLPNLAGEASTAVTGLLEGVAHVRLLRYLGGGTMVGDGYLSPAVVAGLGDVAGRVSRALADFAHPGLDRALQWDLRFAKDVIDALVSHVEDPTRRSRLEDATAEAWSRIVPLADQLPRQAVHLDLTDANVVVTRTPGAAARPDGVIDFGDLSHSWAVSELSITLSSVLGHPGCTPTSILPGLKAFHDIRPLSAPEADALWPLLVLRTAVLIVSGAQQVVLDPDNEYLTEQSGDESRMFEQAISVPIDVMSAVIRAALGLDVAPVAVTGGPLIADVDPATVTTLDLSATSELLDSALATGSWPREGVGDELARAAIGEGASLVVTRFGEPDVTRAPALSQDSPDVVATGLSLWPADAVALTTPWAGLLVRSDGEFTLRGDDYELTVTGATASEEGSVASGATLATLEPHGWTTVVVRPVGGQAAPKFTNGRARPGLAGGGARPSATARSAHAGGHHGAKSIGAPQRCLRTGSGALLRRSATDRARQAPLSDVDGGPGLSRHGQQRHRPGARPPAGGPHRQ